MAESFEMFWGGAPVLEPTGRDERIAAGDEVAAIEEEYDFDGDDGEVEYYNPQTKETARGVKKRRLRVEGGTAPLAKPITVDYDSDDGRIIELKQQGYSDAQVADTLRQEGRVRYTDKTIGSRYLRLRKAVLEKEDEVLDDELSDWHVGEDDELLPLSAQIDKKFDSMIQKLEERKWRDLAHALAEKLGKRKYTHKAVRERVEALRAGTELCPIELDDDQTGRRTLRETRIAAAKAARAEKVAAEKEAEEYKKSKTAARKLAIAEANQKKVQLQLKRHADKKERLRIREERKTFRERARVSRLAILAQMRAQRDWEMERSRREKQLYKQIMGMDMNGKPCKSSRTLRNSRNDSGDESEAINEFESDEEEAEARMTDEEEQDADDESDDPVEKIDNSDDTPRRSKTRPANGGLNIPSRPKPVAERRSRRSSVARATTSRSKSRNRANQLANNTTKSTLITESTLLSPRSIMSHAELSGLCHTRNLPTHPESFESQPELVARLHAADHALSVPELDIMLKASGCYAGGGGKAAKIKRLQTTQAVASEKGGFGLTADDVDFMREYEGYKGEFAYLLEKAEEGVL
ncbi:unnamed protein product [Zymoseptoria tritici ST99CH_1E4]|uniref:DUF7626 domain-containing protein n=2 Tax=Zymoseptoria tritici TaxID=1047171 RepID=F9X200_ZYMTI|nr:uncharacterized protein MYCGRDRAFT_90350 [Zymoseptoria tritici IPO323]EGP90786.1 hypothetical protein MYCGRDRAFT_90350 [Zymoseptoria tritici IPO323]SMR45633.1 unnamed protein product [Zymoseptoria tritici ST99CH_1E4]